MNSDKTEYIEYRYRWVIVGLYAASTIAGSIVSGALVPIATKISQTYDVTPSVINLTSMIYLIAYATMNFPANYVIDEKGLRNGMLIGNGFYLLGVSICFFVNVNFYFVILASIFNSFGNPFIMNTPAKIATYWFKNQNRTVATSILTAMNIVGSGVGFVLPALMIDQNGTKQQTKKQLFGMYILQGILIGLTFILNVVFMKAKPPTPASLGSSTQKTPFKQSIRQLIRNVQFIKLLCGFVFFYGVLNTFGSVCNFIFRPLGFTDIQIATFGVGLLFSGVIGSILASLYVKKTLLYKKVLVSLCSLSVIILSFQSSIVMFIDSTILAFIGICCVGLLAPPVLPITYDLGCQVTFPIGQAQITGILNSFGMIGSFLMILSSQVAIGYGTETQSIQMLIFLVLIMCVGLFFYCKIKPVLKRRQAEQSINQPLGNHNSMEQQKNVQFKQLQLNNVGIPETIKSTQNQYIDFTEEI